MQPPLPWTKGLTQWKVGPSIVRFVGKLTASGSFSMDSAIEGSSCQKAVARYVYKGRRNVRPEAGFRPSENPRVRGGIIVGICIAMFCLAVGSVWVFGRISTSIKAGADEDYELVKPLAGLAGQSLYVEVWDDQPPLYTALIIWALKSLSYSVVWPRIITTIFAFLLLISVVLIVHRTEGAVAGLLAAALVYASPGFLEVSCSCMQEIPSLAPVLASFAVLWTGRHPQWRIQEIMGGAVFAVGLQIKYIGIVYLPLIVLILWIRSLPGKNPVRDCLVGFTCFLGSLVGTFLVINFLTGAPLLLQVQQSWASHFAGAQSAEYGSPADHPFEWMVLLRNWDLTVPAVVGVCFLWLGVARFVRHSVQALVGRNLKFEIGSLKEKGVEQFRKDSFAALVVAWLLLTLVVFSVHRPWWQYYYVHNAVPLAMCAAVAIVGLWRKSESLRKPEIRRRTQRGKHLRLAVLVYVLCAGGWMVGRVYLQVSGIRNSPQTYNSLVLKEIERFKPFTNFIFTDQPVYSFHARIPMPPHLAILSLKRFWTGDMTNERLVAELKEARPELMLLANSTRELPYEDFLNREYRLVYQDDKNSLYAHRAVAGKAKY